MICGSGLLYFLLEKQKSSLQDAGKVVVYFSDVIIVSVQR
jgi:hypothetical protein